MNPQRPDALRAPGPFSMRMNARPAWQRRDEARPQANALGTPHAAPLDTSTEVSDSIIGLVARLTPRRLEVLKFVARGLTNREIASVMGISANTVKAHVTGVLETLDLTNRTEAAMALQEYESGQAPIPR